MIWASILALTSKHFLFYYIATLFCPKMLRSDKVQQIVPKGKTFMCPRLYSLPRNGDWAQNSCMTPAPYSEQRQSVDCKGWIVRLCFRSFPRCLQRLPGIWTSLSLLRECQVSSLSSADINMPAKYHLPSHLRDHPNDSKFLSMSYECCF